MANLQGMEVFAVERHRLSEDFVSFRALCGVQSSPLVFAPNQPFVWGSLHTVVVGTGRDSLLQVYVFLSLGLKLHDQTLVHCINQLTWKLPLRAPAETVEYVSRTVEDGGREHYL